MKLDKKKEALYARAILKMEIERERLWREEGKKVDSQKLFWREVRKLERTRQ